jgi:hypothetical protein
MTGFHPITKVMAPKKGPKKSEDTTEISSAEGDVISDTMPHAIESIKSWRQIYESLDSEIKNATDDSVNHLQDIAESELHKIATCPRLMAYNDMISWALDKVDIPTRSILNDQGVIIGSFRPEHIQVMYKLLPNPKFIYNAEFIAEFQRKECTEADQTDPDLIKGWWTCPSKFRVDNHEIYATTSLNEYMVYVDMMLCRIFGKKNPCNFPSKWVPFLEEASEGYSFNWDKILSDNITKEVLDCRVARA